MSHQRVIKSTERFRDFYNSFNSTTSSSTTTSTTPPKSSGNAAAAPPAPAPPTTPMERQAADSTTQRFLQRVERDMAAAASTARISEGDEEEDGGANRGGDDADDDGNGSGRQASVQRRFSISTPQDYTPSLRQRSFRTLSPSQRLALAHGRSFTSLDPWMVDLTLNMERIAAANAAGPSSGGISQGFIPESKSSSRVERLLRERQIRRSGSYVQFDPDASDSGQRTPVGEGLGIDSRNSSYESLAGSSDRGGGGLAGLGAGGGLVIPPPPQRLLIVANRLPVRALAKKDGGWMLDLSSGGLVSALLGVKQNFETCWIGWPGLYLKNPAEQEALGDALKAKGCVPVFLDERTVDEYYNGYCNNVLWPLLHYIGLPQEDRLSATRSFQSQYAAYRAANQQFADVVAANYTEGDVVWVHDYHLMLLPEFLKARNARMKVGWFLHTPFPSSEFFRTLPLRGEILQAVLAADLIGFHTYDYARHFTSACMRILGLEGTPDGVEHHGRLTRVAAFPIGIDPDRFIAALEMNVVKTHIAELRCRFDNRKVMLGVDRLDMIKGIPQKLVAFEKFLEEHPEWRDKVLLVQIAVPSRTDVPDYQKLTSQVHEIVGRINGRFGTLTTVPIHHLDRSLAFHELCALYAITDVLLVTSLRDGMNLVSYEYVACQNHGKGVLILSEFAGAAQSLGAGAILVNPWNISDVSAAIEDALMMSEEERTERHKHNFHHVNTHTAQAWADTFVSELNDTVVEAELRTRRIPPQLPLAETVETFERCSNRLLILGYNATVTAHAEAPRRRGPDQIKEMKLTLHPAMRGVLNALCRDPGNTIIILSGSERSLLDEAFSGFDCWLAAENGMFMRHTRGEWMTTMPEFLNMDWVESVQLVFEYFCERTPRSYVEARETSLVWNYKYADVEFGKVQAQNMLQHLWTGPISNAKLDVVQGGKSVEVRPVGVSKGAAMERILGEMVRQRALTTPIDFVMVVGHFLVRDEDVFTFFEPDLPFDSSTVLSSTSTSTAAAGQSGPDPSASAGSSRFSAGAEQQSSRSTDGRKSRATGGTAAQNDGRSDSPRANQ